MSNSPLCGMQYDRFRGDWDLDDPARLPLDDHIIALAREFAGRTSKDRESLRRSLTRDDLDTLMCFGQRAAALALRTGDPRWLFDGLLACAMIKTQEIDPRDHDSAPGLIFATYYELGIDPARLLAEAASLAESGMSQILLALADRPASHRELSAWLHDVVTTPKGLGLIHRETSPYHPTVPLDLAVLRIAQMLRADNYAASPRIASTLPDVWLAKVDDEASKKARRQIIAGAFVRADYRPDETADDSWNHILVSLVETPDEMSATTLLELARAKQLQNNNFAMISAQVRQLFCLFLAENFMVGGRAVETNDTLQRFSPRLIQILSDCVADKTVR